MPKFFVRDNQIDNNKIKISGEDVNHISNVLRIKNGEKINICNIDTSANYIAEIISQDKNYILCEITEKKQSTAEPKTYIHIFQGLPKADKMELIIQKSVELGVSEITPVQMERSIVKLDGKDAIKKVDRWRKIAEVAAKQSGRDKLPCINEIKKIKNIYEILQNYDIVIVAYENEKEVQLKQVLQNLKRKIAFPKIAVVIGPEGGIDISEIKQLESLEAKIVTLGERILRTETAALSLTSIIMYEFEGDT